MQYIILLDGKPIEEATPEERMALEEKIKRSFERHLGLKYVGDKVEKDRDEGVRCYTPTEVSRLLKVSKTEAYNIFHSDGFPSFRLGEKKLRVTESDFNKWLEHKIKESK